MAVLVPGPIHLEACLLGGQSFVWERVNGSYEGVVGDRFVRIRRPPDLPAALPADPPADPSADASDAALVEGLSPSAARQLFRADQDLAAVRRRLSRHGALSARLGRWPGLRVLRTDPWTTLVSFILSQNSHVARITRNLGDLSAALGEPVQGGTAPRPGAGRRHALPRPAALVEAGEGALRKLGVGYRAPYLVEAARMVDEGRLDLDRLAEADHDAAREALLQVPGVGPKVAACVQLFGLDQPSAFPVDRWVARALRRDLPEAPARDDRLEAFARQRYGGDAGHAQQVLFHDERTREGGGAGRRRPGGGRPA